MELRALTLAASFAAAIIPSSFLPVPAVAQPEQVEVRAERLGSQTARVITRWAASGEGSGRLVTPAAAGPRTTPLYDGRGGAATITSGHGAWLVAYAVEAAADPFRVRLVRPARQGTGGAGATGTDLAIGEEITIARPTRRHDLPFAVVATATPDGFAVLFQEIAANDPSAATTSMVLLDVDGRPAGPATSVPVPWSLADMIWNGAGYHLALIFPGHGTGMRLSMVSVTAAGQPQQHPDWSSAAGYVADVHLVRAGEQIRAFYRGGTGGRLLESDVTAIRGWGSEPPRARRHGALGQAEVIVVEGPGDAPRPGRLRLPPAAR